MSSNVVIEVDPVERKPAHLFQRFKDRFEIAGKRCRCPIKIDIAPETVDIEREPGKHIAESEQQIAVPTKGPGWSRQNPHLHADHVVSGVDKNDLSRNSGAEIAH